MKKKQLHQVKTRMYYYFWGVCTVTVFAGQLYAGAGYRVMADSVNLLTHTLVGELVSTEGKKDGLVDYR